MTESPLVGRIDQVSWHLKLGIRDVAIRVVVPRGVTNVSGPVILLNGRRINRPDPRERTPYVPVRLPYSFERYGYHFTVHRCDQTRGRLQPKMICLTVNGRLIQPGAVTAAPSLPEPLQSPSGSARRVPRRRFGATRLEAALTRGAKDFLIVGEENVRYVARVIREERVLIDNLLGTEAVERDIERSLSRTTELSLQVSGEIGVTLGADILTVLKTQISSRLGRQLGTRVGETITEKTVFKVKAPPYTSVTYGIAWHQRLRRGTFHVLFDNGMAGSLPYSVCDGLEATITTLESTTKRPRRRSV